MSKKKDKDYRAKYLKLRDAVHGWIVAEYLFRYGPYAFSRQSHERIAARLSEMLKAATNRDSIPQAAYRIRPAYEIKEARMRTTRSKRGESLGQTWARGWKGE